MKLIRYLEIENNTVIGHVYETPTGSTRKIFEEKGIPEDEFDHCGWEYIGLDGSARFINNVCLSVPKVTGSLVMNHWQITYDAESDTLGYRLLWFGKDYDPGIPLVESLSESTVYTIIVLDADKKETGEVILCLNTSDIQAIKDQLEIDGGVPPIDLDAVPLNDLDMIIMTYDLASEKLTNVKYWMAPHIKIIKDKKQPDGRYIISYHDYKEHLNNPEESDLADPMRSKSGRVVGDRRVHSEPQVFKRIKQKNGRSPKVRVEYD